MGYQYGSGKGRYPARWLTTSVVQRTGISRYGHCPTWRTWRHFMNFTAPPFVLPLHWSNATAIVVAEVRQLNATVDDYLRVREAEAETPRHQIGTASTLAP